MPQCEYDPGEPGQRDRDLRHEVEAGATALDGLRELVSAVLVEKKPRIATRPGRRSIQKRLDEKRRRGDLKRSRGRVDDA